MSSRIWPENELDKLVDVDPEILSSSTDKNYMFAYIDIGSVKPNLVSDQLESYTFRFSPSRARKKVVGGDVLMSTVRPNLKSFAKIKKSGEFVASTGFAVLRAKDKISNNDFIKHLIFSDVIARQVDSLIAGSNYPAISIGNIKKLKVKTPPYEEQLKIAEILDSIDEQIALTEQLIKKKKHIKKGLMQDFFDKVNANKSKRSLADMAEYINGYAFSPYQLEKSGIPVVRIEQINNPMGHFDFSNASVPRKNHINTGDLIFSWSGTLKIIEWRFGFAYLNQHLFKVVPFIDVDKYFLLHLIDHNIEELTKMSHGSTMKHIQRGELEKFQVSVPDLNTQIEQANFINLAESDIEQHIAMLEKLIHQKHGLMHDLLTGKVRVN